MFSFKNKITTEDIQALQEMHQKLERRITDFTDVWHPFMTSNINRIKDELIETVQNEIKSSNKLQEPNKELEQKLDILQNKFENTNIEGNIVIDIKDYQSYTKDWSNFS